MKSHYSLTYFISQAVKSLWRNGVMSMASIAVLICCLVVMGVFALLVANINVNLDTLELANEMVIFLDYDATDDDVARVKGKLEELDELGVSEVKYISKEEALETMRSEYTGYEQLFDSISNDENPLAGSFELTISDVSYGIDLKLALENIDDSVRKISDRMHIAQQFETIKKNVIYAFTAFLAVLMVVCVFVIINTISLAVYARRNEIIVMRYVGATGWFISTPFVLEGIIIGMIASVVAFFLEGQIYLTFCKMISGEIALIKLISYDEMRMQIFVAFVAVGVLTGIIGSIISLRKRIEA